MRSSEAPDPSTIAIAALSCFATDEKVLSRFFALTGLDARSLHKAAAGEGFIAGILDFVLSDERLTIEIAAAQGIPPESVGIARARLDRATADDDWPARANDERA